MIRKTSPTVTQLTINKFVRGPNPSPTSIQTGSTMVDILIASVMKFFIEMIISQRTTLDILNLWFGIWPKGSIDWIY